ncbi:hypothetical protein ACWENA_12255 [Streptomyces sp. NPDC004779]
MAEPDPAIHELILDRFGLPAEQCVFVDDHAVNLPSAAEMDTSARRRRRFADQGVHHVPDPSESAQDPERGASERRPPGESDLPHR